MPIGKLARSKLDEALSLADEQTNRKKQFDARVTAEFDEIESKRAEILLRLSVAKEVRNQHVQVRSGAEATVKDITASGKEAVRSFKEAEAELVRQEARLTELQADKVKAKAEAKIVKEEAARIEAELASKMGETSMTTPNPNVAVPELSAEVQAWAQKFFKLEQKETKEYFQAESARIGALLDVRRIGAEIVDCMDRIAILRDEIPRKRAAIEELGRAVTAAKEQITAEQDAIQQAQAQVDAIKEELSALNHSAVLYESLGRYGDALSEAVIEAHREVKDEVVRILSAINAASNPGFVKKTLKTFAEFKSNWGKASGAFKAIVMRAPLAGKLDELQDCYVLAQSVATKFDAFVDGDLIKSANNGRIRYLNNEVKYTIAPAVAARLNGEEAREELHVNANRLFIDSDIVKAVAAECDPFSLEVPEHFYGPIIEDLEAGYGRARAELIQAELEAALEAAAIAGEQERVAVELARLAALDEIGNEPAFSGLKETTRKATISWYKSKPESEATAELVRAELREDLSQQNMPTYARWCRILNLPAGGKAFIPATSFTDSEGEVYKVHISFFSDCFGPAVARGICLMKSATNKYSASEVMELLFVTRLADTARVHASVELKNDRGDQPHVYYKTLTQLHFQSTFQDMIEPYNPHDTGWEDKAIKHARDQLKAHMKTLKRRIQNWLDKDGMV